MHPVTCPQSTSRKKALSLLSLLCHFTDKEAEAQGSNDLPKAVITVNDRESETETQGDDSGPDIPPPHSSSRWTPAWKGKMLEINPSDRPALLGQTAAEWTELG